MFKRLEKVETLRNKSKRASGCMFISWDGGGWGWGWLSHIMNLTVQASTTAGTP